MFKNPLKRQPVAVEKPGDKVETAVVLAMFENGGGTVGYLNVSGIEMNRQATMKDMYRMVCEVKGHLESVQATDRIIAVLTHSQRVATPPAQPAKPEEPAKPAEVKEEKKEDPK